MPSIPFILTPAYKDYIWGGDKLKTEYNKSTAVTPLAESWECSIHKDGKSIVSSGDFTGMTLDEVLKEHPEFIGTHPDKTFGFPLLIKLIDATDNLSIQVHPDDEYAALNENGEHGKTEMWYVLDAEENSEIVYGFTHDTNRDEIKKALDKNSILRYLQKVKVKKGDVFYVPAGTVHAIGKGVVIAEIQEDSDLTYRLFDYDRTNLSGNKRPLHVEKALDVLDYSKSSEPRQPLRILNYKKGYASEFLLRCKYFEVHRILVNATEMEYKTDELSFRVLLCTEGEGTLGYAVEEKNETLEIKKGTCVFIPADSEEIFISGKMEMLEVRG